MIDLYLQQQYAERLGVYLENFTRKKPYLWAFSHSCEKASGKKKKQVRGFIYQHKSGELNVRCHKCGYSSTLHGFIKETSPALSDELRMARFGDKSDEIPKSEPKIVEKINADLQGLISVSSLKSSSSVIRFLERRMIPRNAYKLLYVAPRFYEWAARWNSDFKKRADDQPRLVIPYFNGERVIGFTCRAFDPKANPRYIHIRIDNAVDFIYGLERVDTSKTIYVTEGQIDSLFLDNAIAVGGANYTTDFLQQYKNNCVIIPDNDWKRNSDIARQLKKAIQQGFKICFLPDYLVGKDINDLVKNGLPIDDIPTVINSHTYSGLQALLEYSLNKKFKG